MEGTAFDLLPDHMKGNSRRDLFAYHMKLDDPKRGYSRRPLWPECIHYWLETYASHDTLRALKEESSQSSNTETKAQDLSLAI